MTIDEIQNEIIDEFGLLPDWMDRYQLLIEMGASLPPMEEELKTPANLIEGCQSRVWVVSSVDKDTCMHFQAESDAVIVRGIIALLLKVFQGQKAEDIVKSDLYFIDQVGLHEHLSSNRSNGLTAMIKRIKTLALNALVDTH